MLSLTRRSEQPRRLIGGPGISEAQCERIAARLREGRADRFAPRMREATNRLTFQPFIINEGIRP